ncbi:MAG: hypothetical protein HZB35_05595 [Nitrospirae bacterium]|nr:hypothetical protein [Nitrospirota bacterium]
MSRFSKLSQRADSSAVARTLRVMVFAALFALGAEVPAWAQAVSGIRGLSGGVGALFSYFGPGNLYVDNQGIQGYVYNFNLFETYSFRAAGGQAWSGGVMTFGAAANHRPDSGRQSKWKFPCRVPFGSSTTPSLAADRLHLPGRPTVTGFIATHLLHTQPELSPAGTVIGILQFQALVG